MTHSCLLHCDITVMLGHRSDVTVDSYFHDLEWEGVEVLLVHKAVINIQAIVTKKTQQTTVTGN